MYHCYCLVGLIAFLCGTGEQHFYNDSPSVPAPDSYLEFLPWPLDGREDKTVLSKFAYDHDTLSQQQNVANITLEAWTFQHNLLENIS